MSYRFFITAVLAAVSCSAAADTAQPAASQRVLFSQLARQCGRNVHPDTLQAVARVESSFNPFVIGVVGGRLAKQPRSFQEAVRTAERLHAQGRNFSMGLMQVNRHNLKGYGLDYRTVFDPCANVRTGAAILADCFKRAGGSSQADLHKAFSCYYSGNFRTGFRADFKGQPPYVVKILNAARQNHAGQTLAYIEKYGGDRKEIAFCFKRFDQQDALPFTGFMEKCVVDDWHRQRIFCRKSANTSAMRWCITKAATTVS